MDFCCSDVVRLLEIYIFELIKYPWIPLSRIVLKWSLFECRIFIELEFEFFKMTCKYANFGCDIADDNHDEKRPVKHLTLVNDEMRTIQNALEEVCIFWLSKLLCF